MKKNYILFTLVLMFSLASNLFAAPPTGYIDGGTTGSPKPTIYTTTDVTNGTAKWYFLLSSDYLNSGATRINVLMHVATESGVDKLRTTTSNSGLTLSQILNQPESDRYLWTLINDGTGKVYLLNKWKGQYMIGYPNNTTTFTLATTASNPSTLIWSKSLNSTAISGMWSFDFGGPWYPNVQADWSIKGHNAGLQAASSWLVYPAEGDGSATPSNYTLTYNVDAASTGLGTVTATTSNGTSTGTAFTTGGSLRVGTYATIKATANTGYELTSLVVNGTEKISSVVNGSYGFFVSANTTVVAKFGVYDPYFHNYGTYGRSDGARKLNSLTFQRNSFNIATTSVNQGTTQNVSPIYFKYPTPTVDVKPGDVLTVNYDWTGGWMHNIIYVDWNKDETFATDGSAERIGYNAGSSDGTDAKKPISYTIPASQATGQYRMRIMIDWIEPSMQSSPNAAKSGINTDGGVVVDVILNVTNSVTPAQPTLSNAGTGLLVQGDAITITSETGTTIKYTTDGSDPATSGTATAVASSTANVTINGAPAFAVKAVATNGTDVSAIASKTYNTIGISLGQYYNITFNNGGYNLTDKGAEANLVVSAASTPVQLWQVQKGSALGLYTLTSKAGNIAYYDGTSRFKAGTAGTQTDMRILASGTAYEIQRSASTTMAMNMYGGAGEGKEIAEYNLGDGGNKLLFSVPKYAYAGPVDPAKKYILKLAQTTSAQNGYYLTNPRTTSGTDADRPYATFSSLLTPATTQWQFVTSATAGKYILVSNRLPNEYIDEESRVRDASSYGDSQWTTKTLFQDTETFSADSKLIVKIDQNGNYFKVNDGATDVLSRATTWSTFNLIEYPAAVSPVWIGNSYMTVGGPAGTWYTGSNSYVQPAGHFNGANLGDLSNTLDLGGEIQAYDKTSNDMLLYYQIDGGTVNSIPLPLVDFIGNNTKHYGTSSIDISTLGTGTHTIAVWFKAGAGVEVYDSNNSANYVATFSKTATGIHTASASAYQIAVRDGRITIPGADAFEVYTVSGQKVNAKSQLNNGIYIVKVNNQALKVHVK